MGAKLMAFYEQAKARGGIQAKVKLAMITKLSSNDAESAPDSPENIKRFEEALKQV